MGGMAKGGPMGQGKGNAKGKNAKPMSNAMGTAMMMN